MTIVPFHIRLQYAIYILHIPHHCKFWYFQWWVYTAYTAEVLACNNT